MESQRESNLTQEFTKGILDYVYLDLWGPARTLTHGNGRFFFFFLSVVDYYLQRVWVYVLKSKDEEFLKFKEWKTLIENQARKQVKRTRTDNGLENFSEKFNKLYA